MLRDFSVKNPSQGGVMVAVYPVRRHPEAIGDRHLLVLAEGGEPYYTALEPETAQPL